MGQFTIASDVRVKTVEIRECTTVRCTGQASAWQREASCFVGQNVSREKHHSVRILTLAAATQAIVRQLVRHLLATKLLHECDSNTKGSNDCCRQAVQDTYYQRFAGSRCETLVW